MTVEADDGRSDVEDAETAGILHPFCRFSICGAYVVAPMQANTH
jgi:hypothetical protein